MSLSRLGITRERLFRTQKRTQQKKPYPYRRCYVTLGQRQTSIMWQARRVWEAQDSRGKCGLQLRYIGVTRTLSTEARYNKEPAAPHRSEGMEAHLCKSVTFWVPPEASGTTQYRTYSPKQVRLEIRMSLCLHIKTDAFYVQDHYFSCEPA